MADSPKPTFKRELFGTDGVRGTANQYPYDLRGRVGAGTCSRAYEQER